MFPFATIAYAATPITVDSLLLKINQYILNPIIALLFVIATVVFLAGLVRFYIAGDEKTRAQGHELIKWGIVGMFIMVSVFGIMRVIVNTIGVNVSEYGTSIPTNN